MIEMESGKRFYRTEQRDDLTWIVCNICNQETRMGGDEIVHVVGCEVVPAGGVEKTVKAKDAAFARLTAPDPPETFWNGSPCKARVVLIRVAMPPRPTWWSAPFAGQTREAVEIIQDGRPFYGKPFYIDNGGLPDGPDGQRYRAGNGWKKVTSRETNGIGHRIVHVAEVISEIESTSVAGSNPAR